MIIRSQDKRLLVNFDNVSSIWINDKNKCVVEALYPATTPTTDLCDVLGTYSTEEKAIKVLDKIEKNYILGNPIVEMPQDNEVTV